MSRWLGTTRSKSTAHAIITVYDGDIEGDAPDFDVIGEYYVTEKRLAQAIENAVDELDVFTDVIPDDDKSYKMPANTKRIPNLFMRKGTIPTKRTWQRSVACCAYNATDGYLQHWLGRKLDKNDRDWYCRHHLVTTDGLPQEFTFTVLQQLVEPYGCGIKGIQVPRNTRRFDEHKTFIEALGANPMFKVNGNTSNEEAYEMLYPEAALLAMGFDTPAKMAQHKKDTFAGWRFECVDMPDLGAVAMKQFSLNQVGHNGGSNYYGPRASFNVSDTDKWLMAVKFDELRNINYLAPIDLPEYQEYEGTLIYDWWAIKCAGNKTLRGHAPKFQSSWQGGKRTNSKEPGAGSTKTSYFSDPLKALGYSVTQITKMSWKAARELKDGKIKADGISILDKGDWLIVKNVGDPSEGQQTLLLEDKSRKHPFPNREDDEEKVKAYPPLCEECQKAPGDNVYGVEGQLICQNCGTDVPIFDVPVSYLLDGWNPADEIELVDDDDTDDFKYGYLFDEDWDDGFDFGGGGKRTL